VGRAPIEVWHLCLRTLMPAMLKDVDLLPIGLNPACQVTTWRST
jgi:hypothetical protein